MIAARRIVACLKGVATGDAIGKQTETLAHADVRRFVALHAAGVAERRWPAPPDVSFANAMRAARADVREDPSASGIAARGFPDRLLTIVPLAVARVRAS